MQYDVMLVHYRASAGWGSFEAMRSWVESTCREHGREVDSAALRLLAADLERESKQGSVDRIPHNAK